MRIFLVGVVVKKSCKSLFLYWKVGLVFQYFDFFLLLNTSFYISLQFKMTKLIPNRSRKSSQWHFIFCRASVLSEVQTSRNSQLPSSKNLLVLGDKESGKTTLIAKLQGNEDPKKGAGLEYGYIDVRDEYRDGKPQNIMSFWYTSTIYYKTKKIRSSESLLSFLFHF